MNKIKTYCSWNLDIDLEHSKQIELYIDRVPVDKTPPGVIRFLYLLEPPEIINLTQQAIVAYKNGNYNFLFAHNQEVLDQIDNSFVYPLGSCWIKDFDFKEKRFEVSTLVGGKTMAPGHLLRQKLWFKENKIQVPKKFYLSGNLGGIENYNNNPVLGSEKNPLFESQFHICIENVKRKNWWTEKLEDCLQTKTVPIYYGCPNIDDWFDTRGFIIVDSLKDIIRECNNLTPDKYQSMLPYVEENYKRSMEYANFADRLKCDILEVLKQNDL